MMRTINSILVSLVQPALMHIKRKLVHERITRDRQKAVLNATSADQVREIARSLGFTYFLNYDAQADIKQREFQSAVDFFNVNLNGKAVLDVGPGTADSLDYACAHCAVETMFLDEEPIFVKFAELKGHTGEQRDYRFKPFFPSGYEGRFNFIYSKGSVNCDWVNEQANLISRGHIKGFFDFDQWLKSLKKLGKDNSAEIVFMPAMGKQKEKIVDPKYGLETYHWCPDIEEYKNSHFVKTLLSNGFSCHENIPGFTQEKSFPLAFHYKNF